MSTDITPVISIMNSSRQDGALPVSTVNVKDTPEASGKRQAPVAASQDLPPDEAVADKKDLQKAVSDISAYAQNLQRDLQFRIDTDLGKMIVSVVDSNTKEVIRQIPSEDVLERARFLKETASTEGGADGLLLQVRV